MATPKQRWSHKMIRPTAYCDECGRAKNEGNHWFHAAEIRGTVFLLWPWGIHLEEETGVSLIDWKQKVGAGWKELDLCSESCAVKAMAKAIGSTSQSGDQNG
jgi:hypothetical protein